MTDIPTLDEKIEWLSSNYKKAVTHIAKNPIIQSKLGATEKMLFLGVRKQIVCIDDLERSGDGLRMLDVLGLASSLKEDRGCKVVLLLNDEELDTTEQEVFNKQLEKVTDVVVNFEPEPEESAALVFDGSDALTKMLHENCVKLGITNIRVIKKIERSAKQLHEILEDYPSTVNQIAHSVTLYGWSVYKANNAPAVDYLESFSSAHALLRKEDELPGDEKEWAHIMKDYNFLYVDDFDRAILEGMKNGYFDRDKMLAEAQKLKDMGDKSQKEKLVTDAWNVYHHSFDTNDSEVLETIYKASMDNCDVISPTNLSSTVGFLKEFGKETEAATLLKKYISVRGSEKEIFDINNHIFSGEAADEDVLKSFKQKLDSFTDDREPKELLIDMAKNRGWNLEDPLLLAKLSSEDFYKLFKETKGEELYSVVRGALMFSGNADQDEDKQKVLKNVTEAMQKIAAESPINARRVAMYGVKLEENKGNEPEELK
ncbi:MAG: hypothetical protein ACI9VM_000257 [Candidatus Azotimanducaceae bacterium]